MFLLFLNLRAVPKKSTPAKLAYIRHFQRCFSVMFSPPSPSWMFNSSVLCPSTLRSNNFTKSNLKICFYLYVFTRCGPAKVFGITKRSKNHTGPQLQTPALTHQSIPAAPIWKPENVKFSVDCPPPPSPPPPASWGKPLIGALQHLPPPPPTLHSPFYPCFVFFSYHFFHLLKLCLDFLRPCFHIIRLLTRTFSLKRCGSKRSWT